MRLHSSRKRRWIFSFSSATLRAFSARTSWRRSSSSIQVSSDLASKVVATLLLCISNNTSILWRMVPPPWGPESVPLLSCGRQSSGRISVSANISNSTSPSFSCRVWQCGNTGLWITLAAKTLQSYIPWHSWTTSDHLTGPKSSIRITLIKKIRAQPPPSLRPNRPKPRARADQTQVAWPSKKNGHQSIVKCKRQCFKQESEREKEEESERERERENNNKCASASFSIYVQVSMP